MYKLYPYDHDAWSRLYGNEEVENAFDGYTLNTLDELNELLDNMDEYALLYYRWFVAKDSMTINYTSDG